MAINATPLVVPFCIMNTQEVRNIRLFRLEKDGPLGVYWDDPEGKLFDNVFLQRGTWPYYKKNFFSLEDYLGKGPVTGNGKTYMVGTYTFTIKLDIDDYNGVFRKLFKAKSKALKTHESFSWENLFNDIIPVLVIRTGSRRELPNAQFVVKDKSLYITQKDVSASWLWDAVRLIRYLRVEDDLGDFVESYYRKTRKLAGKPRSWQDMIDQDLVYIENLDQKPITKGKQDTRIFYSFGDFPVNPNEVIQIVDPEDPFGDFTKKVDSPDEVARKNKKFRLLLECYNLQGARNKAARNNIRIRIKKTMLKPHRFDNLKRFGIFVSFVLLVLWFYTYYKNGSMQTNAPAFYEKISPFMDKILPIIELKTSQFTTLAKTIFSSLMSRASALISRLLAHFHF